MYKEYRYDIRQLHSLLKEGQEFRFYDGNSWFIGHFVGFIPCRYIHDKCALREECPGHINIGGYNRGGPRSYCLVWQYRNSKNGLFVVSTTELHSLAKINSITLL